MKKREAKNNETLEFSLDPVSFFQMERAAQRKKMTIEEFVIFLAQRVDSTFDKGVFFSPKGGIHP